MKRILTTTAIFIAFLLTLATVIVGLRLPNDVLIVIGGGILISIVAIAGAAIWYVVLMARMNLGIKEDQRRIVSAQAEAAENQAQIVSTPKADYAFRNPQKHLIQLSDNPYMEWNGEQRPVSPDEWQSFALQFASAQQVKQGLLPASIEQIPDLLPILDNAQRVLIKAASDGGKTTLLQHIAERRQGAVLVLDSQSYPNKWPAKCKVVGTGSNHQAISVALDNLIELMVKRYQEIGEGVVREGEHPKLTIIIDEWMAIVSECSNAPDAIRRLLTESRKAAMSVFIGSHSERVKSLGLDGRGDLRDGFLIIRIDIENGERKATYDQGRGEKPCLLPGQFVHTSPDEDSIFTIEKPVATDEESRVLEMLDNGESFRSISNTVWGQRGSFYNDKILAIAQKFGREVRN